MKFTSVTDDRTGEEAVAVDFTVADRIAMSVVTANINMAINKGLEEIEGHVEKGNTEWIVLAAMMKILAVQYEDTDVDTDKLFTNLRRMFDLNISDPDFVPGEVGTQQ